MSVHYKDCVVNVGNASSLPCENDNIASFAICRYLYIGK